MKIALQSPGLRTSKKLARTLTTHLSRLEHLTADIIRCDILLKKDGDKAEPFIAEVRLAVPGNDLFAVHRASSFLAACERVCGALEKQIQRHKARYSRKKNDRGIIDEAFTEGFDDHTL